MPPCAGEPIGWLDIRDLIDRGALVKEDLTTALAAYLVTVSRWAGGWAGG